MPQLKKKLLSVSTTPSDFIKVPLSRRDRSAGFIEVKLRNIPDGKYQELENVYIEMLQLQEAAGQRVVIEQQEIEAKAKRPATPREILALKKKHAKTVTEAQATFFQAKIDLIQWALVAMKPFEHNGKSYELKTVKDYVEDNQGIKRHFDIASPESLEALKGLELGYGSKRYPLLAILFDVVFDYQNCYLTDAESIWADNEATPAEAEQGQAKEAPKTALETKQGEQPDSEATPAKEASPGPLS